MKPLILAGDIDTYNIPCITGHPAVMKEFRRGRSVNYFIRSSKFLLIRTQYLSQMQVVAWIVTLRTLTPLYS